MTMARLVVQEALVVAFTDGGWCYVRVLLVMGEDSSVDGSFVCLFFFLAWSSGGWA